MMTTTTYDPVQIARTEADAAVLKALLVRTNTKMTYLEFGQSIGLCASIEHWTPAHTAKLALIAQGIYDREHRCRRYDAKTWDHITRESGKTWTWGEPQQDIGTGRSGRHSRRVGAALREVQ